MDPYQTALKGAVSTGSTLFVEKASKIFQQMTSVLFDFRFKLIVGLTVWTQISNIIIWSEPTLFSKGENPERTRVMFFTLLNYHSVEAKIMST